MQQSLHQLLGLVSIAFLMSATDGAPIRPAKLSKRDVPLDIATVLETPMAATLYDPSASWKAPLVPAGKFNPMPLITKVPLPPSSSDSSTSATKANTTAASNSTAAPPTSSLNSTKALSDAMQVDEDVIKGLTDSLNLAEDSLNSTTLPLPLPAANGTKLDTTAVKANTTTANVTTTATQPTKQKRALLDRRSMKREWTGGVLKRRSTPAAIDDLKDVWCPSDQRETLVPVTFTELYEMKIGKSKLQPSFNTTTAPPPPASSNSTTANNVTSPFAAFRTPQCVDKLMSTVIVVPVSELQMNAIENGALVMKSTEQRGVVTLMTSAEMELDELTGESSVPPSAGDADDQQDTEGPIFVVVPVPANATSTANTKLPVFNTISGSGIDSSATNQTSAPSLNTTAPAAPVKANASASPAPASPPLTILGPASLKRRSRGMPSIVEQGELVKRADEFQRLQRRVKPSNASNTEIIGNGEGKRKYGHAIHFNAAPDAFSVQTSAVLFVVGSLFASVYL